jgi:hypothetical protein
MMNFLSLILYDLCDLLPKIEPHEHVATDVLITLASFGSLLGLIAALLMLVGSSLLNKFGKLVRWLMSGKFLTWAFVIVWLAGFVVYDVGMYIGHSASSLLANAPMAVIHAFEMFLLDSDVAAIHDQFHDNMVFMACFSIVHFAAAFITLVFVVKHFGFNIIAGFKMMLEAYIFCRKKETFVFWGMNDASFSLAQSINEHFDDRKKYRIIVVRTNHDAEETSGKNGMERLFNFLSLKNKDLERLQNLNCLTTSTYSDLAHLDLNEITESPRPNNPDSPERPVHPSHPDILRKHISLKQLARIIRNKTQGKVHLFFLSDDSNDNIQAVGNLKRDMTINAVADEGIKVFLYCQARYNSVHRVIEDEQLHDNIVVKVVDASHISVEMLKQQVELQPVSYVDIEKDATVSSAFNALVIGFGEVGYDTVRFLYEFGAFVKTGSDSDRVEQSDFHCDIVDKDIKNKAGLFAVNAPSVSHHMSYNQDDQRPPTSISLHDMDVLGVDFYDHLERMIGKLNYVVIALDDDVANVSLAVRIFRLAVRYRESLNHFRILVRVRNDNDGHLLRIAEHYNRLWAAQANSDEESRNIHQRTVKSLEAIHEPITLFGALKDTFTYDYIVSDILKTEAKHFKEKYDQSISTLSAKSGRVAMAPLEWESEHRDLMQLSEEYKGFSPTLSGIMRLRRVQSQNTENCFHKFTKQMLASVALGEQKYRLLTANVLSRKENEITYSWQEHEPDAAVTRVLDVIAQTEHLRWMASHEILGYRDFGGLNDKNEARLLHGCLKPWSELTTPVKSYDYNVVDVSLGII